MERSQNNGLGGLRLRNQPLKDIKTARRTDLTEEEKTTVEASGDDYLAREERKEEVEGEPVSPASRMFHEPDFNIYIIAILGSNTAINPQQIKANLQHTLVKHPRFSSIQVWDEKISGSGLKWVRTKVDLDEHIIVPDIDHDNMGSRKKFVEDYVFNISKTSIDLSRPMWDIHLLNFKNPNSVDVCGDGSEEVEAGVGIFRAHHSLGDGASLMSLLLACTRQTADPAALPRVPERKMKEKQVDEKEEGRLRRWFAIIVGILAMAWNSVVDVAMFMATAWFLKDTVTPLKGPPGVEFAPRRFVHRTVSLDDIKLIKNAMNATINDVALGIAQAGLSRYLNRKYGQEGKIDGKATEKKNNLPKNIRLRATLLINLRPAGMQALAKMMAEDSQAKWGNWVGFVLLPFKIALRDDPLDYVREAKATVDRKKNSLEAYFTSYISDFFLKLFGIKAAGAFSHKIVSNSTMCFSNLVGPLEEIGFCGHPITYIAPSSYGQPQALMINFQSYVDKMSIVLSVDENTIPDPHQLCDDLVHSFNLIKDAVVAGGLVSS